MKLSVRNIARATRLARSTVSDYLRRARIADLEWPLCDSVDEQVLWEKLFHEDSTSSGPAGKGSTSRPLPEWSSIHKELRRKHVTLQLLWEEYRNKVCCFHFINNLKKFFCFNSNYISNIN